MKTIKLLLIIGITAFNLTTAFTQTHVNREWMTEFGYPDTLAWSKTIPFDNKLLHVGNSLDTNQNVEMLITLTDLEGNIEWQENYSETSNSNDYGVAIDFDDFGNVYVVGTTDNGGQDQDIVLLKYNDSGQLQWSFTYDSPYGLDDVGTDLTLDGDGMIYVCGTSQGNTTDLDYVTFCYYTNDEFVWVERYDYNDLIDVPIGIEYLASTGEVTVTGASASATNRWDYAFVSHDKTNGNLTNITRQPLSTIGFDMPTDVVTHHEGNIYVTGRSSNDGINYDIRTVKLDSAYNIIWSEKFDFQGGFDIGHAIEVDSSGNVYVGGSVTRANNVEEMILIKYDKTGSELWHHVQASEDFTQPAYVKDITVSAHGDLYFLGEEFSNENLSRLVVGKIDSTGKTRWQRRTNQDNHEHPISIQWYDDTVLYTNSALEIGGGEHVYKTRKYAQFTQDASITYEQDTIPVYRSKELIVRFKQNAINVDAIDNLLGKKTEFAPLEYYISPQAMQTIDNAIVGTCDVVDKGPNRCGITAVKIFKQLTSDFKTTKSRLGETIRVPDFWTTLLLSFPESVDLEQAYNALSNIDNYVAYVEVNYISSGYLNANDPFYEGQYNLREPTNYASAGLSPNDTAHINIEEAWEIYPEAGREDIKCGVYDRAINKDMGDFSGGNWTNYPSKVRDGWDFTSYGDLYSTSGIDYSTEVHGTQVAGIIGAIRNNDFEIAGIAGGDFTGNYLPGDQDYFVDKGISLYSLRILDSLTNPLQFVYESIVMAAIKDTLSFSYGLHIANHSWGISEQTTPEWYIDTNFILLSQATHFANRAKVSQVVARGNTGTNVPIYPAVIDDDWILTVGGTGNDGYIKGQFNGIPNNSSASYGSIIDVAAPFPFNLVQSIPTALEFGGTSASAPHVSGLVGLILSYFNDTIDSYNNLSPEDCERIIELSAINSLNPNSYDSLVGWGRIDAGRAMRLIEKPYGDLLHYGTQNNNGSNIVIDDLGQYNQVLIEEHVQANDSVWINKGEYNLKVYKVEAMFDHTINLEDSIYAFWSRPSSSSSLEPIINGKLLPRERAYIDFLDKDSCIIHGFVYEVLDLNNNFIAWLPHDTSSVEISLEYSILTRDSIAPPLVSNVEIENFNQKFNLFPNPTNNFHTVKIDGFANENISITLYDLQGRSLGIVYEGKLKSNDTSIELDVSLLPLGLYLYDVRLETERKALRFIKN